MELIADILLICGTFAATTYCVVLSRRLNKFTDLEKGVGGAIAVLSTQVDDMTKTLKIAQTSAAGSASSLDQLTAKAEAVARRLELLVASMHDIPDPVQMPENKQTAPDIQPPLTTENSGPLFLSKRIKVKEAAE